MRSPRFFIALSLAPIVASFVGLLGCGAAEPIAAPSTYRAAAPSCAGTSITLDDRWYCVQPAAVRFEEARAACQAEGMQLASVHSAHENDALQHALGGSLLRDPGEPFWIGLFEPEEGKWFWSTDAVPSYGAWAAGEPNDQGGENCATVVGSSGTWNDASCTEPRAYLCEAAEGEPLACTGERITTTVGTYCFYATKRPWLEAFDACKASGGLLATLDSAAANAAIARALTPKLVDPRLWIGATDQGVEAAFIWTDGSPWTFSAFAPGEPNDQNRNEDCTEWDASSGRWNDLPCSELRGALCEAPVRTALVAR